VNFSLLIQTERIGTYVRRAGLAGTGLLVLGLPLPWLLGLADASYLTSLALVTGIALACTIAHSRDERRHFLALFAAGLAVRFYAHVAVYAWAAAAGGPFLKPDASMYLQRSLFLAADNLRHELPPLLFFGTYDCAHYYLFAALIRFFGTDLYGLQTFNFALTALAGPFVFGALCAVLPRFAFPVGVLVTLSPSLISFGIVDLLKDPGVIASTLLALWALAQITRVRRPAALAALVVVAVIALSYTRMSRFYVVPFLAIAFLFTALLWQFLRGSRPSLLRPRRTAGAFLVIFLLAELVPMRFGWPMSGGMVAGKVLQTINLPQMRIYAKGMFDREPAPEDAFQPQPVPLRSAKDILQDFDKGARMPSALEQREKAHAEFMNQTKAAAAQAALPQPGASSLPRKVLQWAVNGFRKLFGPFPWVMPPSWHAETILTGDYLMFPGMLIWYAVMPLGLAGLAGLAWWVLARRRLEELPVMLAGAVMVPFFVQYLVVNLSWRQREFTFPFLAVLACLAVERWWHTPYFRKMYRTYWILLGLVAMGHLIARAYLVG
jgi:hypothetical protein